MNNKEYLAHTRKKKLQDKKKYQEKRIKPPQKKERKPDFSRVRRIEDILTED